MAKANDPLGQVLSWFYGGRVPARARIGMVLIRWGMRLTGCLDMGDLVFVPDDDFAAIDGETA